MGSDDTGDLPARILESLEEKPRSISEIARELDVEKYAVSKKIEVLEDQEKIDTYRIGRSTACILNDDEKTAEEPETADNRNEGKKRGPGDEPDTGPGLNPEPDPLDDPEPDEPDEQDTPGPVPVEGPDNTSNSEDVNTGLDAEDEQSAGGTPRSKRPATSPNPPQTPSTPADQRAMDAAGNAMEGAEMKGEHVPQSISGPGTESSPAANTKQSVQDAVQASQSAGNGQGPRTIGIVSGKGGVGKTVVTLNLGAALMDMGENVIVMDADAEMPNVGLQLGMYTYPTSLHQIVEQEMHIMSAMHVDKDSGLRVIPTALSAEYRQEDIAEAIGMIPEEYIVLIDSPPGLDRPVEHVIDACDELIFVTTPEIPAVTDTYKLYREAQERGKTVLGAILNRYESPKKHLSVAEVEESLELSVLGVIPESGLVQQSIFDNQPAVSMNPHAKPARAFKQVAADLTGNRYELTLMDKLKGLKGLLP